MILEQASRPNPRGPAPIFSPKISRVNGPKAQRGQRPSLPCTLSRPQQGPSAPAGERRQGGRKTPSARPSPDGRTPASRHAAPDAERPQPPRPPQAPSARALGFSAPAIGLVAHQPMPGMGHMHPDLDVSAWSRASIPFQRSNARRMAELLEYPRSGGVTARVALVQTTACRWRSVLWRTRCVAMRITPPGSKLRPLIPRSRGSAASAAGHGPAPDSAVTPWASNCASRS